jgi:hypothetical protein
MQRQKDSWSALWLSRDPSNCSSSNRREVKEVPFDMIWLLDMIRLRSWRRRSRTLTVMQEVHSREKGPWKDLGADLEEARADRFLTYFPGTARRSSGTKGIVSGAQQADDPSKESAGREWTRWPYPYLQSFRLLNISERRDSRPLAQGPNLIAQKLNPAKANLCSRLFLSEKRKSS